MSEITKGSVYRVGSHIVGCGSSLDKEFVKTVIAKNKIRAVVTDPPYGVAYVENKQSVVDIAKPKVIQNDHLQSESEYIEFSNAWISAIIPHLSEYNTFHIFNADSMFLALRTGMVQCGLHFAQMLIWLKNQPVMGRMDYLPQQELIAYGWYGKHKFEGSKAKNLIVHPRPSKSKLHPTQKPIGLLRKLILNVTRRDEYVYDGFLGSGSTAIACEHLGRRCIGIELDPEYVEVILTRLEKLTGKKRELISNYEG